MTRRVILKHELYLSLNLFELFSDANINNWPKRKGFGYKAGNVTASLVTFKVLMTVTVGMTVNLPSDLLNYYNLDLHFI